MQNEQENSNENQLNFSEQDFNDFAKRFSEYLANANESKKRGNNDYNPLKAVQNPYDEVNMHSGFLVSFLNPKGEHYQDDLFLKLFLRALQLDEWFGSTKNARVFKEEKKIDIHISNGENHIIIENKISAPDQDRQIARYIDAVKSENVEYENIAVVYLTPLPRKPENNSLGEWDKDFLFDKNGKEIKFTQIIEKQSKDKNAKTEIYFLDKALTLRYQNATYKSDILAWIESCQKEVGNIVNLNAAFEFYKDIVKIITKQKESKMNIAEFFKDKKVFDIAYEIIDNNDKIDEAYFRYQTKPLEKELERLEIREWKCLIREDCKNFYSSPNNKWKYSLIVYNENYEKQTFRFIFALEGNYVWAGAGARMFIKHPKYNNFVDKTPPCFADEIAKKLAEILRSKMPQIKLKTEWWLKDDESIYENAEFSFVEYFLHTYKQVVEVNEFLKNEENNPKSELAKLAQEVKKFEV